MAQSRSYTKTADLALCLGQQQKPTTVLTLCHVHMIGKDQSRWSQAAEQSPGWECRH